MKLGISSAVFYPLETEKAVDEIIKLGFHNVELFLNCEYEFSDEYIIFLKDKLQKAQIDVVSVHPYTSVIEAMYFFSGYKRRFDDALRIYERYFKASAMLGANYFTFHGDRNFQAEKSDVGFEKHCEILRTLCTAARNYDIQLCQENVSWCLSSNPNYIKTLKKNLGEEIGFTLDMKQARRAEVKLEEYIAAMGDRLVNIHISDYDKNHSSLLPGMGNTDFMDILSNINNYKKSLIIEVYSTDYDNVRQIESSKIRLEHYIFNN